MSETKEPHKHQSLVNDLLKRQAMQYQGLRVDLQKNGPNHRLVNTGRTTWVGYYITPSGQLMYNRANTKPTDR